MANRRLAAFAQLYLQHMLRQQEQERQYELQGQNQLNLANAQGVIQREGSAQRAAEALLPKVMNDPGAAFAMINSGRDQLAGQDLAPFAQDSFAPELKQFASAKSLSDLPSALTALNSRIARKGAPITSLDEVRQMVEARNAQSDNLASVNPTKQSVYNPLTGTQEDRYLDPRYLTGQSYQTTPTPEQAGLNAGKTKLAELKTPGLEAEQIAQKIREVNQLAGPQAKAAGLKAGAEQGARTAAEIQAKYKNLPILKKIEEEIAQARATGKPTNGQTFQLVGSFAQRMVDIASALNTDANRSTARMRGLGQSIQATTGLPLTEDAPLLDVKTGRPIMNQDGSPMTRIQGVGELESLSQGLTSTMLRALGRVGTPTENDEKRTRALFPAIGLQPAENANRNANFLKLVNAAEKVGQRYGPIDPNLPLAQQEALTAQRLAEAAQEAQTGGVLTAAELLGQ